MTTPISRQPYGLALLAIPLLLAGCAVGPDYQRPATSLPGTFTGTTGTATASDAASTAISRAWWKAFNDPLLDQLIDTALRNNTDVLIASARVEEADAVLRQAGAALFPEIDANLGSTHSQGSQKGSLPQPVGAYKTINASLSTSFELDFWGKLRRASEAARAQALASRYGKDTVELSLVGLVIQNYLNLRALDAQLSATQDSQATRDAALRITRSRLAAGLASQLDEQQALSAQAALQAQSADLRRQRAVAEHQLALLSGDLSLTIPVGDLRQLPLPPLPPAGLPSTLLEARPDVSQAEAQLIAANAKIGVAKAALFPTISLTASVGSQSKALASLFTNGAGTWSTGLGMFLPIFDAGKLSARVDEVTAQQKQAAISYQKTVQTAFKEVSDALVNIEENRNGEQAVAEQLKAAQKSLTIADARYQAGYSRYLEVLDAQRSSNDASLAFIRSRQAQLNTIVDLYKALGGGWSTPQAQAQSEQK